MKHRSLVARFGRREQSRKALIRGLVKALLEKGSIRTTVAKAKELRRHAERAITTGKPGTLHARRLLLSRYPHVPTVDSIMTVWAPLYKSRPGGYTRILKLGRRPGDQAEMALIELVDRDKAKTASGGEKKAEAKAKKPAKTPKKSAGKKTAKEAKA